MPFVLLAVIAELIDSLCGPATTMNICSDRPNVTCVGHVVGVSQSASTQMAAPLPRSAYMPVRGVVSLPTRMVLVTLVAPSRPPVSV